MQRLEATWRGVAWLVFLAEGTREIKLRILTVSWAGIVRDWRDYRHTKVNVELEPMIRRAVELSAFLEDVPYARYDRHRGNVGIPGPR